MPFTEASASDMHAPTLITISWCSSRRHSDAAAAAAAAVRYALHSAADTQRKRVVLQLGKMASQSEELEILTAQVRCSGAALWPYLADSAADRSIGSAAFRPIVLSAHTASATGRQR